MEHDYLSVDDLSPKELGELLDLAADVKARPEVYAGRLAGRSIALIFETVCLYFITSRRLGIRCSILTFWKQPALPPLGAA